MKLYKHPESRRLGVRVTREDLAKLLGIANGRVYAAVPDRMETGVAFAVEIREGETNATPNDEYQKLLDKFLADIDHISASKSSS